MLGYGFDYNYDIDNNQPIDPNSNYAFVTERGFKKSSNSKLSGIDIINLKNRELDKVSLNNLKDITKKAISTCLDGRDLASRKIFKSIKQ